MRVLRTKGHKEHKEDTKDTTNSDQGLATYEMSSRASSKFADEVMNRI
jgi:hypothetical protein